jgi:hypothetical protein
MPRYAATVEQGYCNTDRNIRGTRLRHPGKGRYGNKLVVRKGDAIVFKHNAAETYRHNEEVERWLADELARGHPAQSLS